MLYILQVYTVQVIGNVATVTLYIKTDDNADNWDVERLLDVSKGKQPAKYNIHDRRSMYCTLQVDYVVSLLCSHSPRFYI